MLKLLQMSKKDGIATVTIDNPPMNVLSQQVLKELGEVFTNLKEDDGVISIILTGKGDKAFMAGADIKEFPERENNKDNLIDAHAIFDIIENIPKPTIALINGFALGGGLELALTCDIRIAEDHAQVGLPEVKLGLLPGAGGTQRLPRLVGPSKAKEIMFTGDPLSADEALNLGIVNRVVKKGEGMKKAESLARKLASHSLQAVSRIKELVNIGTEMPLKEALKLEEEKFEEVFQTEDSKEGVQAFIEKRKPEFKHR